MNKLKGQKILVIAPHPDDEVLGCGGTISKLARDGNEIYLCIVTDAYGPEWSKEFIKHRPEEVAKANRILGIKKTFFLHFPTIKLDTVPQKKLNDSLQKVIAQTEPDTVYLPSPNDLNRDHRLVFESALVVTRPNRKKSTRKILCYEVLSETDWGQPLGMFDPNVYIEISTTLPVKIKAMRAYPGEIRKFPHPRSVEGITVLAKKRGMEAGMQAAEAFRLIRELTIE